MGPPPPPFVQTFRLLPPLRPSPADDDMLGVLHSGVVKKEEPSDLCGCRLEPSVQRATGSVPCSSAFVVALFLLPLPCHHCKGGETPLGNRKLLAGDAASTLRASPSVSRYERRIPQHNLVEALVG